MRTDRKSTGDNGRSGSFITDGSFIKDGSIVGGVVVLPGPFALLTSTKQPPDRTDSTAVPGPFALLTSTKQLLTGGALHHSEQSKGHRHTTHHPNPLQHREQSKGHRHTTHHRRSSITGAAA